ncbi:hypothetical protein IMZ48_20500 [Candidatus Bathyarchaeota archaeon]|nr:hypothetical protein [Candidatus Bathyarchaeota archaeon]
MQKVEAPLDTPQFQHRRPKLLAQIRAGRFAVLERHLCAEDEDCRVRGWTLRPYLFL